VGLSNPTHKKDADDTKGGMIVNVVKLAEIDDVKYYGLDNIMISAASMFTTLTGILFLISFSRQKKDF